VYEAATLRRITLPSVPVGEIRGVQISPSERWMALYVNGKPGAEQPLRPRPWTGKFRRLTQNLSAEVDPTNLVEAQVVRFPSYDGVAVPSLLYRPLQVAAADRAPAYCGSTVARAASRASGTARFSSTSRITAT